VRTAKERLLDDLAGSLRGPRRARRRLLTEIEEDFEDALRAERAAGLSSPAAEAEVLARFGCPEDVVERWNSDQAERRVAIRRNAVLAALAAAIAGALGVTQYASGRNAPVPQNECERQPSARGGPTITTSRRGFFPPGSGRASTPSCSASLVPTPSPPGGK
jgi:hypothetical protein